MAMLTPLVVSVSVTFAYVTEASSRLWPRGQLMSDGGGLTVSDAVTFPFLPELKVPLADTGPLRAAVSSFVAVSKTAGSAYVGWNPTPATTSAPAPSAQLRAPARPAGRGSGRSD